MNLKVNAKSTELPLYYVALQRVQLRLWCHRASCKQSAMTQMIIKQFTQVKQTSLSRNFALSDTSQVTLTL